MSVLQAPTPDVPGPGWYEDPWRRSTIRWWDGTRWTPYTDEEPVVPEGPGRHGLVSPLPPVAGYLGVALAVMVTLVGVVALVLRSWAPAGSVFGNGSSFSPAANAGALLLVFATPLLPSTASKRLASGDPRADLGLSMRWTDIFLGAIAAVGAFLTIVSASLFLVLAGLEAGQAPGVSLRRESLSAIVLSTALIVVLVPVATEILLRGLVFRGLASRMGGIGANVVQVLLAIAMVTAFADADSLLFLGMVFGILALLSSWLLSKTGRLAAGMTSSILIVALLWWSNFWIV